MTTVGPRNKSAYGSVGNWVSQPTVKANWEWCMQPEINKQLSFRATM